MNSKLAGPLSGSFSSGKLERGDNVARGRQHQQCWQSRIAYESHGFVLAVRAFGGAERAGGAYRIHGVAAAKASDAELARNIALAVPSIS